jgi:hypothetical protein
MDVPTHSFRNDECEMGVCGARRVVLWQMTEEELRQYPSERTIILVELAIIVPPDGQVICCAVVISKLNSYSMMKPRTSELCRQEAIPPSETDRVGKNRSRNCVSGT